MKNKLLVIVLLFVSLLMVLPLNAFADLYYEGHNTLNLKEALEAEGLELENTSYTETDDQAIVYLFRGQGCGYCKAFLTFLNSISKQYGDKFKLVSFEVWYDESNNNLMNEVSEFTGEEAGGVPYIVIGKKVFPGYDSAWNEDIIKAITDLYDNQNYDVFKELSKSKSSLNIEIDPVIAWNFVFVAVATGVILFVMKKNNDKVLYAIDNKRTYGKGK